MKIKQYKKLNNTTELKKTHAKLTKWFNLYIRLRDLKRVEHKGFVEVWGRCCSCSHIWELELFSDGSIMNGKKWHCGHYWKSDRHESVRYDERNCALQCYHCNKNLSGNEANFQIYLKKKLGEEGFAQLTRDKNKTKKYNILELEQLTVEYKLKAKLQANKLQIKI
jgi:hypothetical protein